MYTSATLFSIYKGLTVIFSISKGSWTPNHQVAKLQIILPLILLVKGVHCDKSILIVDTEVYVA